jgi:hypothetical protein
MTMPHWPDGHVFAACPCLLPMDEVNRELLAMLKADAQFAILWTRSQRIIAGDDVPEVIIPRNAR